MDIVKRLCKAAEEGYRFAVEAADEIERLYDLVGEAGEDGIDVTKEAEKELEAFLVQWSEKHTALNRFYTIEGKSRQMQITEADLADND